MTSELLIGKVRHHRLAPIDYAFEHDVFYLAIDLAELDEAVERLRLLGYNRANVMNLRDSDHFDGGPLAERAAAAAQLQPGERLTMISYPRVLGYVFNPVSFYLVHGEDDRLRRVVAEVHNTHGERHVYLLADESGGAPTWRSSCEKRFYVSPFLALEGRYTFAIRETAARIEIRINEMEGDRMMLHTGLRLERRPLTNGEVAKALLRVPLVGLKTTALIHRHALSLWRKRVTFSPHRPAGEARR
jgi:DUF1365 family protein